MTDSFVSAQDNAAALKLCKLAFALEQACPSKNHDHRQFTLCHVLTCAAELSCREREWTDAETFATMALDVCPCGHAMAAKAHVVMMKVAHRMDDVTRMVQSFEKAMEVTTSHLGRHHIYVFDTLMTMVDLWEERQEGLKALSVMEQAVAVLKDAYGRKSIPFAGRMRIISRYK
jgi:hypothetical protein